MRTERSEISYITSDRAYFNARKITRDKPRHYAIIKGELFKKI